MNIARFFIIGFQLLGLCASAFLISTTYLSGAELEDRLRSFASERVESAADTAWRNAAGAENGGSRAERLGVLAGVFGDEAEAVNAQREALVPALVAYALSDRCGERCGSAYVAGLVANTLLLEKVASLRLGERTVGDFIVERYDVTIEKLKLDLRRFGLVNLITLALMTALLIFRDMLNWRFAALSCLVTGYVGWAAYGYLFRQDWARTILMQDWTAGAYQALMILVCCFCFDWLFLRGLVSRFIGNALVSAIS